MASQSSGGKKKKSEESQGTGFARRTDYRWLALGILLFLLIAVVLPTPQSMTRKAEAIYLEEHPEVLREPPPVAGEPAEEVTEAAESETIPEPVAEEIPLAPETSVRLVSDPDVQAAIEMKAYHIQIIIALLATCVVFFATEAVPLPAVALTIGLVQLFFGTTAPRDIVATYAHDAVWFIAGSLALGATLVKYGLDKRIGMFVMKLSGTNIRRIIIGLILGTSIPAAFIGEHAVAGMYLPIAVALYTLTSKRTECPRLGKLLAITIAFGCMIGGPMSPTGGARNAIMIGFLSNLGIEVSFVRWLSMGVSYTLFMAVVMAFILPFLFKPEVKDLSYAVDILRTDLEKHGKMTKKQWLVAGVMFFVIFMWITDKTLLRSVLGFSLGLGGIAVVGTVLYMLLGLTTWKDYEEGVSWGVVVLYAGAISLGAAFKTTGAAEWLADSIMAAVAPLGITSGVPLIIFVAIVGAALTNLMSAGATVAVIGPVILGMAESSGTNPMLVGVTLAISTSAAFWLVIGTPASSIVYSSGLLTSRDFIRGGSLAWPFAILVIVGMILVYWLPVLGLDVTMN